MTHTEEVVWVGFVVEVCQMIAGHRMVVNKQEGAPHQNCLVLEFFPESEISNKM